MGSGSASAGLRPAGRARPAGRSGPGRRLRHRRADPAGRLIRRRGPGRRRRDRWPSSRPAARRPPAGFPPPQAAKWPRRRRRPNGPAAAGGQIGTARFEVADALSLGDLGLSFDTVPIDSGLFHVFDDDSRARYVASLASVLRPGGHLYLMCFSDRQPGTFGPRRVSQDELRAAFGDGWMILAIQADTFAVNLGLFLGYDRAGLAGHRQPVVAARRGLISPSPLSGQMPLKSVLPG